MNYLTLLYVLAPEMGLVVLAFAILAFDLFGLRDRPVAERSKWLGAATAIGLVVAAVSIASRVWGGPDPAEDARWFNGMLVVDDLALVFKVIILALTILTVLISMGSEFSNHVGEYYALLIFGALGMMFLVTSEELIMIFVSLELLSLCLYILTGFAKAERRSTEAAIKYYVFGALCSAFLLFGMSYLYGLTGETSLSGINKALAAAQPSPATKGILILALVFTTVGFGFKVAVVPFHLWAPDAYQGAPTPVTAFIATGSKVASFVVLLKVMMIGMPVALQGAACWWPLSGSADFRAGWVSLLALISVASMILGNVAAIVQHNIKRLLAYSSIAHGGYILLGVLAANDLGEISVLYYVIVYGLANVGAFGVVQALAEKAGGDSFDDFRGMARRAPFLSLTMLIFVLSLAGIPPLGGFFGKFYLFLAASKVQSLGLLWLVIIGIATSAVSLYYYLVLLKQMYVVEPADATPIKASYQFGLAASVSAALVLLLGVFPGPVIAMLTELLARSSLPVS